MMPTISVVVPCYNYAHYLPICLDSILSQEGVRLDVTIVDDCSTDDTPEVCAAYAAKDPRVKVIRNATNLKNILTYNVGIEQATGEYFTLVSADDILTPGALLRAVTVMENNPDVVLTYGAHICVNEYGNKRFGFSAGMVVEPRVQGGAIVYSSQGWRHVACLTGRCPLIGSEAVVRTWAQQQCPYNPLLPHSGDMEMWLRLAQLGNVAYLQTDQLLYRVHGQSMQMTYHHGFAFDLEERRRAFQHAFGINAISTDDLILAEEAIDYLLRAGEGGWWKRNISERLRHRHQRKYGLSV